MPDEATPPRAAFSRRDRAFQAALIASTACLSWLGFMALHELGHCLNAWVSGGEVERVVLGPFALSRTDLARNPHPVFVAWGGALWGVALPLLVWGAAAAARLRAGYLFRFLAGFCLVANGTYFALDAFLQCGDGRQIAAHGGSGAWPALFGAAATVAGFVLWNGTGAPFGLGPRAERPSRADAVGVAAALAIFAMAEVLIFGC